jgi:hypothetical protein
VRFSCTVKLGGLNHAFWPYWNTQYSGRGQTLRAVGEQTYMLLKPETLATLNRGRKLNTPLNIGNNVYSLFAACPTCPIPLPLTSKPRFRPPSLQNTGNNPRNVRSVSEQIYSRGLAILKKFLCSILLKNRSVSIHVCRGHEHC